MAIYLTLKLEQIIVFVGAFVNIKFGRLKQTGVADFGERCPVKKTY